MAKLIPPSLLSESPDETDVQMPVSHVGPIRQIGVRILLALGLVIAMVVTVYLIRDGYHDEVNETPGLLDVAYYATVSLTTTGYGDITPVTPEARLVTTIVITPLRMGFLILLVGTTVELLATTTREQWRIARWRKQLQEHTVVIGFGTKGRSAVDTLLGGGVTKSKIVVVDPSPEAVAEANAMGLGGIVGDATRGEVLRRAEVQTARRVIVAAYRDDTAVMVTLTSRQLNPTASIIVAVREEENVPLLRQSGADLAVTSSDSVGRLLGLSTVSPSLGNVLQDLLTYGAGLEVAERAVLPREEGKSPRGLDDVVVGVVRGGEVHRYFDPAVSQLLRGDRLVVIRSAEELPWAPRPGAEDLADTMENGDLEQQTAPEDEDER